MKFKEISFRTDVKGFDATGSVIETRGEFGELLEEFFLRANESRFEAFEGTEMGYDFRKGGAEHVTDARSEEIGQDKGKEFKHNGGNGTIGISDNWLVAVSRGLTFTKESITELRGRFTSAGFIGGCDVKTDEEGKEVNQSHVGSIGGDHGSLISSCLESITGLVIFRVRIIILDGRGCFSSNRDDFSVSGGIESIDKNRKFGE